MQLHYNLVYFVSYQNSRLDNWKIKPTNELCSNGSTQNLLNCLIVLLTCINTHDSESRGQEEAAIHDKADK